MKKTYFPLLDAVRFLAAFWVMNFHYLFVLGLSAQVHWYRYGNLGVQLFFIVSGFVIVQSLQGKTLREFATGRFIRLFPLFWILCTATYVITLVVPHANPLLFTDYLSSMTMLGDTINEVAHHGELIDASYWTLTVELIFYIGIGTCCYLFSYKNIRTVLGIWLVLSATAFVYGIDQNFYPKLLLVRHASYFVFGGALALIATKQAKDVFEKYFDWALLFVSATYSIYINPRAIPAYLIPNPLDGRIVTILLIVMFTTVPILVYLSMYIKNIKTIKILAILGGITYPLYLLHQTIGNTIINYVTNAYAIRWDSFAIAFEVFIIALAYIVYLQDKKLRAYLQKRFFHTNKILVEFGK